MMIGIIGKFLRSSQLQHTSDFIVWLVEVKNMFYFIYEFIIKLPHI